MVFTRFTRLLCFENRDEMVASCHSSLRSTLLFFIFTYFYIHANFSEINTMTKQPPASQSQGLMANPELSNILKNSLFSQVNVSIGTAGVSREGEICK